MIFDSATLAAADEVATTLNLRGLAQLTGLHLLARKIDVYYSRCDVAMCLSTTLNVTSLLGFDGPVGKNDTTVFPPSIYGLTECTDIRDYDALNPPDASHPYYRRSKAVRALIAAAL